MDDQTLDYARDREPSDDGPRDDARKPRPLSEADTLPTGGGSPRKQRLGIAAGSITAIALIAGGVSYWLYARHYVSTDDAFIDSYSTQMASQVAGRVTALLVQDNQHVQAGQVLLRIDPRDYQARLDQAAAQRANAAAQLEQARAQIGVQQAALDQALATARVAEADLMNARQDYQRYRAIDPHAVTRQQIDAATATFRAAEAQLDADRQAAKGAEAQVSATQAQVQAAQAQVQIADANVESARLQLSYSTLLAPVAGRIAHRSVDLGNYVNPGQALFAIVQDNPWVTANFKETQLGAIQPGQTVDIAIDAIPSVTFHGHVDSFQAGTGSAFSVLPAENATGNFVKIVQRLPVKIAFDDDRIKQYQLATGMSVVPSVKVR